MNLVARYLDRMAKSSDPELSAWAKEEQRRRAGAKRKASGLRAAKVVEIGRMKPTSEQLDRRTAEVRARVVRRCEDHGSVGELCGRPLDIGTAHLCHLDGGSGKRRQEQWEGNCVLEHEDCHEGPDGFDAKPMAWLPAVDRFCKRVGAHLPARFRRLAAKAEAREGRRSDRG